MASSAAAPHSQEVLEPISIGLLCIRFVLTFIYNMRCCKCRVKCYFGFIKGLQTLTIITMIADSCNRYNKRNSYRIVIDCLIYYKQLYNNYMMCATQKVIELTEVILQLLVPNNTKDIIL